VHLRAARVWRFDTVATAIPDQRLIVWSGRGKTYREVTIGHRDRGLPRWSRSRLAVRTEKHGGPP